MKVLHAASGMCVVRPLRGLARAVTRRRRSILVAGMMKSGSTFLTKALREATGYVHVSLSAGGGGRDFDLSEACILRAAPFHSVTQDHTKGVPGNISLLNQYNIRPIVLVRNLYDVMVSWFDHLHRGNITSGPHSHWTRAHLEVPEERQFDMIVDLVAPWYIHFYTSWYDTSQADACDLIWVTYEELIADSVKTIRRILEFHAIQKTDAEIAAAVDRAKGEFIHFNVGVKGRGIGRLTEAQKQRIIRLTSYYPQTDFAMVGID